ncbi:MAG: PEBP family protein, partial [Pseudomonadota bacterium]
MGDGGAIVQIRDGAGQLVAVSDDAWRCLVVHTAPLDRSCERESNPVAGGGSCTFEAVDPPEGWHLAGFDASGWAQASVYSEREVVPRGGYEQIQWSDAAQLIWGPDLAQSNTVLCRLVVD